MKSLVKFKFFILIIAVLFSFGLAKNAFAEETNLKIGLGISPGIQRAELDPGAVYNNSITIHNLTSRTLKFTTHAEPYYVEDLTYAPIYNVENAYTQIARWITFEQEEYTIEPDNYVIVNYTVRVPTDAPGGGQYAALFVETQEDAAIDGTVQSTASAGSVFMADIHGETRRTGEIVTTDIPSFLLNPPLVISTTAKNTGNIDETLRMTVKVDNYFSGASIYDGTDKPQDMTIFPDTSRTSELSIDNIPRLGVLKVATTIEYLGDAEIKTRTVIVCPLWFIAIIILIILTIIFRIFAKKRDDRRTRANSRNSTGSADKFNI